MSVHSDFQHPGTRIKAEVIPAGISVTKAAELMGVGRPALSNLLNGNAALSADMAARLERHSTTLAMTCWRCNPVRRGAGKGGEERARRH